MSGNRRENLEKDMTPRKRVRMEESSQNVCWQAHYTCTKCRVSYQTINLMEDRTCLCPSCSTSNMPKHQISRKYIQILFDRKMHLEVNIKILVFFTFWFQLRFNIQLKCGWQIESMQ